MKAIKGFPRFNTPSLGNKLVGTITAPAATAAVASAEAASGREAASSAAVEAPAAATPSASSRHAGEVRPLRHNLDVPSLEHALVQHQRLSDETRLRKLDVSVAGGSRTR